MGMENKVRQTEGAEKKLNRPFAGHHTLTTCQILRTLIYMYI